MKGLVITMLFALSCSLSWGQVHGRVVESLRFESRLLKEEVYYSIYLPADYDQSRRSYPVVYLLHAFADDETSWIRFGQIARSVELAIHSGRIVPMVIVMPDAKVSWYINDYQNKTRYEDMFFQELIPEMEKTYRVQYQKEGRAVAGMDMGGYGAMLYALKHPNHFGACALLNAAILTDDWVRSMPLKPFDDWYAALFCGKTEKKDERLSSHWRNNNVLELVKNRPDAQLSKVRYYIDCGDDDEWISGNCALHLMLREKNVPHEFRVRDGGHNWSYVRSGIADALEFISQSFAR